MLQHLPQCPCIVHESTMPLLQDKYTVAIFSNIITLDLLLSSRAMISHDSPLLNKIKLKRTKTKIKQK